MMMKPASSCRSNASSALGQSPPLSLAEEMLSATSKSRNDHSAEAASSTRSLSFDRLHDDEGKDRSDDADTVLVGGKCSNSRAYTSLVWVQN
jgi:hypothetical protein